MKFPSHILIHSLRKGALVLALGVFLLPACANYEREKAAGPVGEEVGAGEEAEVVREPGVGEGVAEEPLPVAQQIEENVELDEITGNIEDYVGRTVSVRSPVTNAVGESAFLLQNEGWFDGEEVLAINATGQPFVPPDDVELQVTGEVRQFVLADIERDYGIDLDPELYVDYEQEPVIIAQSVALAPDPDEVTEDPTRFYNQVIAVEGEIGEFVSAGIFRLEEDRLFGGEGLLVLSNVAELAETTVDAGEIEEDTRVVVTGVLRPYIRAEFERDYDFWDPTVLEELEVDYNREPVLVAGEVYASAEE